MIIELFKPANRKRLVLKAGRERADHRGVNAAEPGIGRVGDEFEDLREEEPVHRPEVRPLAQVLARVRDAFAFDRLQWRKPGDAEVRVGGSVPHEDPSFEVVGHEEIAAALEGFRPDADPNVIGNYLM